jgi:hypothetical protein
MRALWMVVAASACYSPSAPTGAPCADNNACPAGQACVEGFCGGRASSDDAATDAPEPDAVPIDAPALCTTWTAEHVDPCALPAPLGDLTLTQAESTFSLDTDTGTLRKKGNITVPIATMVLAQTGGPDLLVVSVEHLTVEANARLTAHGVRPVLIAVWDTANIVGDIDVSASFTAEGPGGAGTTSALCGSAPTGNGGTAGTPSTGGGGGGFGGDGGRGGNTSVGAGLALPTPTVVRGGCAGGVGGASTTAVSATRGAGGGAIEIAARTSIAIASTGAIEASGGAGRAGVFAYGAGGGGGAGGYIGLDAPSVTIAGTVTANGGSGGGGASDIENGSNGANGLQSDNPAIGGAGATTSNVGTCIKGGNGSGGAAQNGVTAAASPCGGGGGGGGAGYILIWSASPAITGTVSPPFIAGP